MKTKLFLLISATAISTCALGAVLGAATLKGQQISLADSASLPMRLVISYDNNQLINDPLNYHFPSVKTMRGTSLTLVQFGVSYHDGRIYLEHNGQFGNCNVNGLSNSPINGMASITFSDYDNVEVSYGYTENFSYPPTRTPDDDGVVHFPTRKPSYFSVQPADKSRSMYFGSMIIDFDCLYYPDYEANSTSARVRQSFYGIIPDSISTKEYSREEPHPLRPDEDYIYCEQNTVPAESLDLHNLVVDFTFDKNVDGQKTYTGIRLDDPYVSNLSITLPEEYGTTMDPWGEARLSVSFTYKGYGHVNASVTCYPYHLHTLYHRFVRSDNFRLQENNDLPEDKYVYIKTYLSFTGYYTYDLPSSPLSGYVYHDLYTDYIALDRTLSYRELEELHLDGDAFTSVGEHSFSFKLDTPHAIDGDYYVYDDSSFKSMSNYTMPESVEVGTSLAEYVDTHPVTATFDFYDGTSRDVTFTSGDFDFSKVDTTTEGLYPYTIHYGSLPPIHQFMVVNLTDVGSEDEHVFEVLKPDDGQYPTVMGFDQNGAYTTLYLKELRTYAGGYRAVCFVDEDKTFERIGQYELYDAAIVLFGQLGASRVAFAPGSYDRLLEDKAKAYLHLSTTSFTATGDSYLIPDCEVKFYKTKGWDPEEYGEEDPVHEMMIEVGDVEIRSPYRYLNDEHTRISFQFPSPFMGSYINLTASIDEASHRIHVDNPYA